MVGVFGTESVLSKRKVFIGIPVHSGQLMISTVISLVRSIREMIEAGWEYPKFYFRVGDADLCRARNAIIFHFLEGDCTDLMMIDADISWEPDTLVRFISHEKDFVLGSYRGRTDDQILHFVIWPDKQEMWQDPVDNRPLLKIRSGPIGFCRLKRTCVQSMVDSLEGKCVIDSRVPDERIPWLIDFEKSDGFRMEEGYALCRHWNRMNGEVWLDPTINLGHMGPKVFESNFMEYLKKLMDPKEK